MKTEPEEANARSSPERIQAWNDFAERLEKVLGALKEDHGLIVQEKGTNRYVQFLGQGAEGMRVEAVSNAYLSGREQLTSAQADALLTLGWNAPTGTPEEATPDRQPEGSPNFMRQFPAPVDARKVAALAVATLADVIGVPHPGFLCYEGRNVDTGDSLSWTELGLKVAEPRGTLAQAAEQLLRTLREETGNDALDFDDDGDIGLRSGSVLVFVPRWPLQIPPPMATQIPPAGQAPIMPRPARWPGERRLRAAGSSCRRTPASRRGA